MNRRIFLGSLAATLTAGCTADSGIGLAFQTIRGAYRRNDHYPLSPAEIAAIPYSTMGFWMTGGLRAVIVMETLRPPFQATWRSADGVLVTTQNGLIVAATGLPTSLRSYEYQEMPVMTLDAIAKLGNRAIAGSVGTSKEAAVPMEAHFEAGAPEQIAILGEQYQAVPVIERIRLPSEHWKSENRYWFRESDGLAIKGRRAYFPDVPALNWERFKTPAPASSPT